MSLKVNIKSAEKFLSEKIKSYQARVNEVHQMIHEKTGPGSAFLGWLDLPNRINQEELKRMYILNEKHKDINCSVVIGIGGSYLGTKAGLEFLKIPFKKEKLEIIFAGHHLSANYLKHLLKSLNKKKYAINVISKSGTTTEPALAFRFLSYYMETNYGKSASREPIFATTDQKSG